MAQTPEHSQITDIDNYINEFNYQTIREKVLSLKRELPEQPPKALRENLIWTYKFKLLNTLENILLDESPTNELEKALSKNWAKVKNTLLSYTACPNDALTLLLCDIAEQVGEINQKPAISLLMPGISLENVHENYPPLNELNLKELLRTHILKDSGNYLIPLQILSELNIPINASRFNNYYYDYEIENTAEDELIQPSELRRLFSHSEDSLILLDAARDYERLLEEKGLLGALTQLIKDLRMNSAAVNGSETNAGDQVYSAIIRFNDYYNLLDESTKQKIPATLIKKIEMLLALSSDHVENANATENLRTCISNHHVALKNDVKQHESILIQLEIDGDKKLEHFQNVKNHYESCKHILIENIKNNCLRSGSDKLHITRELLNDLEITPMLNTTDDFDNFMSLDPEEIKELAKNTNTLKAIIFHLSRRYGLPLYFMELPVEHLRAIMFVIGRALPWMIGKTTIIQILALLEDERLDIVFDAFIKNALNVISEWQHCAQLLSMLSPDKCAKLCAALLSKAANKLPWSIRNMSTMEQIFKMLKNEHFDAVFDAFLNEGLHLIKDSDCLESLLRTLEPEKCGKLCKALQFKFFDIMDDSQENYHNLFSDLNPDQIAAVFGALKENIPEGIDSAGAYYEISCVLNNSDSVEMYQMFKPKLMSLIKDIEDLTDILAGLLSEEKQDFYIEFKEQFANHISNAKDFSLILEVLDSKTAMEFYVDFKDVVVDFIQDAESLKCLWKVSTKDIQKALLDKFEDKILDFIVDPDSLFFVFSILPSEFREKWREQLQQKFSDTKEFGSGFCSELINQKRKLCTEAYLFFSDKMDKVITSPVAFAEIMLNLEANQRSDFYNKHKTKLPKIAMNAEQIAYLYEQTPSEDRKDLLNILKDTIPTLIKEPRDFYRLFEKLDLNITEAKLPDFLVSGVECFHTCKDFEAIRSLAPEKCALLCSALQSRFPQIMMNKENDYHDLFINLSADQIAAIFAAMKENLPQIISTSEEFAAIADVLNVTDRVELYEIFKPKLSDLIHVVEDFTAIYCGLDSEQSPEVANSFFEDFKEMLPNIVKDCPSLEHLWSNLNSFDQSILDIFKDSIADFISESDDLVYITSILSDTLKEENFELLQMRFYEMIKSGYEFASLLRHQDYDHSVKVYSYFKNKIKGIVKSIDDFVCMSERIDAFYSDHKEMLAELVTSKHDLSYMFNHLTAEQCVDFLFFNRDKIYELIEEPKDFLFILDLMAGKDVPKVLQEYLIEALFSKVIKSPTNLSDMLSALQPDHFQFICNALKNKFLEIIRNGDDYGKVLSWLTPEQCKTITHELQKAVLEIIKNGEDLRKLMMWLTPAKRKAAYEGLESHLPVIIKNGKEFGKILWCLNTDERKSACILMMDSLPDLIQDAEDFFEVLRWLDKEQSISLCEALQHRLPEFIKRGNGFGKILCSLNPLHRSAVCYVLATKIPELLQNGEDCTEALHWIKAEFEKTSVSSGLYNDEFAKILSWRKPSGCQVIQENSEHILNTRNRLLM